MNPDSPCAHPQNSRPSHQSTCSHSKKIFSFFNLTDFSLSSFMVGSPTSCQSNMVESSNGSLYSLNGLFIFWNLDDTQWVKKKTLWLLACKQQSLVTFQILIANIICFFLIVLFCILKIVAFTQGRVIFFFLQRRLSLLADRQAMSYMRINLIQLEIGLNQCLFSVLVRMVYF